LLVHATALDSIKQKSMELYNYGKLLARIGFADAPVYCKDIFNPQKDIKQVYEIYLFDKNALGDRINDLWQLGFDRQVEVISTK